MNARLSPRIRGFTLLELLVALAVFSIMAIAAYSGLESVLRLRAGVERQAEALGRLQMAFTLIQRDVEQAIPRPIRNEFGQEQPALIGGRVSGDPLALTRTGWDNPLNQLRSSQQRVVYRLEQDRLLRLYWPTLDRSGYGEPRRVELLGGVEAVALRFLDADNQWQGEWPPRDAAGEAGALPRALELTLELEDWGPIVRLFMLAGGPL
ncbi:MAG: type II secretion system minor pseudopilin GspJ [Candidatus Competibacteraceae bacterium]|nr:type II secretion system minor pseudopilin GspJ [Candidatus Competibacteraceae bacterium]